ncbi:hypothetical protein AVEN_122089-2-1, partial [Araneus ventricosus]
DNVTSYAMESLPVEKYKSKLSSQEESVGFGSASKL